MIRKIIIFVHHSSLSWDNKLFSRQLEQTIKASKVESSDGDKECTDSQESMIAASKTCVRTTTALTKMTVF